MNAYYENNGRFSSNNRIFEGCFPETKKSHGTLQGLRRKLTSSVTALAKALSDSRVCRFAKAISLAVSLVGFVGVIGAIEHGGIGLGTGLLIGSVLLGVEYLCLRGRRQETDN